MIINIPLQIDETNMEKAISAEYERKVTDIIVRHIEQALISKCNYYSKKPEDGMKIIVQDEVYKYLDQHKDEICRIAGEHLADRLAKTKRGKELLEEVENDKG